MPRFYLVTAILVISLALNGCQTATRVGQRSLNAIAAPRDPCVHAKARRCTSRVRAVCRRSIGGVFGIVAV